MELDALLKEIGDVPRGTSSSSTSSSRQTAPATRPSNVELPSFAPPSSSSRGASAGVSPSPHQRPPQPTSVTGSRQLSPALPQGRTSQARAPTHDVDALLQDLDFQLTTSTTSTASASRSSAGQHHATAQVEVQQLHHQRNPSSGASSSVRAKCTMLHLGGPGHERGRSGSAPGLLLCCDRIRCTKCDFKVIHFSYQQWLPDVDYLFFRNNYPTESKLAPMLRKQDAYCAYCCQCSWTSVAQQTKVDFGGDLRWICGGH